ncbi:hypothetical protein TWF173_009463 [Orbilia oligospora]|uniref:Sugar phosphate phosphatase n=2 Tax=Orbilia oligospora TaxID=2813651 RepID=G1XDV4_ARTOA|nr:hypothetical protein AOL_s00079g489 [Orbilia oligospora ATCC 24927]EGX48850.1 hypothetical protein AOL_s00079g489 [Orbilia oligospora ATCC 24927]KAF3287284.1 hypothetical protein TWF970_007013 [Orbilia oligospora]KAF3310579.1 hypothetical protein TWF173_009463 [Orbilia oligospora]
MPEPYQNSDQNSFAFTSATKRWPIILTQAIDAVFRAIPGPSDEVKTKEGRKIVEDLAKLKYELQHNRVLPPLRDDGLPDIAHYNDALVALGEPKWMDASWLFSECYLYRRIATYFTTTTKWNTFDVFLSSKLTTLRSSLPAILELAHRYSSVTLPSTFTDEASSLLFHEIFLICLWGNATDLSLLTTLSYDEIQSLQGSHARKESEKNILANDLDEIYTLLTSLKASGQQEIRVDIVLDNSGFELFVDLYLAGYLLSQGLATNIVLHPKNHPWFVSDVLPSDFAILLNALQDPVDFFITRNESEHEIKHDLRTEDTETIKGLFASLATFHAEGKLSIRTNKYWTLQDPFWTLPEQGELWEDLKSSELVIYKGDLNYRKLTGDVAWPPTTPFDKAIQTLGKESGCRTLTLRTCKADVVVGLDEGVDEKLRQEDKDNANDQAKRSWGWGGKYAVIQFCDGKA